MNDFYNSIHTKIGHIDIPKFLEPESKLYFIGSCFSSNLYSALSKLYLNCHESPFGNVYNPASISKCINRVINMEKISNSEPIYINNLYQHHDFHSKIGNTNKNEYIANINKDLQNSYSFLSQANFLVITLGTAYAYLKDGQVVNNCHKLPKKEFNRELLSIDEIVRGLDNSIINLKTINPKIEVIITLSPVRHLRDSFEENSLSKSILRVSINELQKKHKIHYFPSYEILLDELRDYRWYSKDLTHPSDMAVEYIIAKFLESCGSSSLKEYCINSNKLNSLLQHKIINPESETSKKFFETRKRKIAEFKKKYPWVSI